MGLWRGSWWLMGTVVMWIMGVKDAAVGDVLLFVGVLNFDCFKFFHIVTI